MDWMCLLYYILACLGGALLSWLLFNKNDRTESLMQESSQSKASLNNLLTEFKTYKEDSKAKIYTKDAEISLLKKKLNNSQGNSALSAQLAEQKTKYRTLQNKLLLLETTRPESADSDNEKIHKLEAALKEHRVIIDDKNSTIARMKGALEAQNTSEKPSTNIGKTKKIKKLKKQLKSLKKKNRKLQGQSSETLDIDKLVSLLKKGDLTKHKKSKQKLIVEETPIK